MSERRAVGLGLETEFVAVEVVALGNFEADFKRLAVERLRRWFEGNRRVEKLLGMHGRGQCGEKECGSQQLEKLRQGHHFSINPGGFHR